MSSVKFFPRIDVRSAGSTISGEAHTIGEDTANWVFLHERPQASTGVAVAGYTRVAGAPSSGQFRVYSTGNLAGGLLFNAADNASTASVTYTGIGSAVFARDINRIQNWLTSYWLNVLDYGAVGDGTTDDSAAIQAAINAAADGQCIVIPATDNGYLIATGFTLPTTKRVRIIGSGATLTYSGSGDLFSINNAAGANDPRHIIEGLVVEKTVATRGTGTAFNISDSQGQTVRDCTVWYFDKAVALVNTLYWTEMTVIDNVDANHCNYGLYASLGASAYASLASLSLRDFTVGTMASASAATPYGIYVATNTSIYRCRMERVVLNPDKNNAVAFYSNGDTSDMSGSVNIENVDGAVTGNVGWQFGASATGMNMNVFSDVRGVIATKVSLAGSVTPQGLVLGNQGYAPSEIRKAATLSYFRSIMDDDVSTVRLLEQVGGDNIVRYRYRVYGEPPEVMDWDSTAPVIMPFRHVLVGAGRVTVNSGTTPTAKGRNLIEMNYASTAKITTFTDGVNGQIMTAIFLTANVTLAHSATFRLEGGINYNPPANARMQFIYSAGGWYETGRVEG